MGNVPSVTPKGLCKRLEARGFELKRIKGSIIITNIHLPEKSPLYHFIKKTCQRGHYMALLNRLELIRQSYSCLYQLNSGQFRYVVLLASDDIVLVAKFSALREV